MQRQVHGDAGLLTKVLAAFVLLFATPATAQLGQELVSLAIGDECCDGGDCEDGGGCSDACTHCSCCAVPNAVASVPLIVPEQPAPQQLRFAASPADSEASGFRAAPFRPPTV